MADGKHCPDCGRDVGLWAIVSAGMPDRIQCPHCRSRLGYPGVVLPVVLMQAGLAVAVSLSVWSLGLTSPWGFFLAVVGGTLVLWVPVEIMFARYLRERSVLEKVVPLTPPVGGAGKPPAA